MHHGRATHLVRFVASSSALLLVGVLAVAGSTPACSGEDTSTFDAGPPDEGLGEAGPVDAQFVQDAGEDGGACVPAPLNGFTAPVKLPGTPNTNACTMQQLSDYYTACLQQPFDTAKCDTFKQANGTCGSCIDTVETDTNYGPVVWYNQRQYYTVNIAGCIAIASNDTSKTGCGGTYEALLECRRASCEQCLSGTGASFTRFEACQKSAGTTVCEDYYKAETSACHDLSTGIPADKCLPPNGSTAKDAFLIVAPFFCGPKGDAG